MKATTKMLSIGIPAVFGLGAAWLGVLFIRSERTLEKRRLELERQLASNEKGLRRLDFLGENKRSA